METRIDSTRLNRLLRVARLSQNKGVAVGWVKNSSQIYPKNTKINTATVAYIHEHGLGHQTPKRFMANGISDFKSKDAAIRESAARLYYLGEIGNALDLIGSSASQRIQDKIREISLIDTGLLRQSVSWSTKNSDTR